jgi:MerR HTH family regulatory protein
MTDINTNAVPQRIKKRKRSKRRKPWPKLAEQHGVCTRTLDRWAERGIIDPPEKIRGRKYGDPDAPPRLDVA